MLAWLSEADSTLCKNVKLSGISGFMVIHTRVYRPLCADLRLLKSGRMDLIAWLAHCIPTRKLAPCSLCAAW